MGSTPSSIYSASGVSAILGMSPYKTRFHAWQNIMEHLKPGFNKEKGYELPVFEENSAIRWGLAFENAIIKLAEERENCKIGYRESLFSADYDGNVITHDYFGVKSKNSGKTPFITCHIDGALSNIDNGVIIHEGKTTWSRAFYSIKGEDCNDETGEIEFKRRWGEPGTDQTPVEYQVQAAVQRICTGAELVKLSVLVFPKSTQEFEELGWSIHFGFINGDFIHKYDEHGNPIACFDLDDWAKTLAEMGFSHTYNLPTNKKLESLIIEKIQEFDEKYVKTELPPEATDYSDIRRMLTQPMGTIVASDEMISKASEYSEIVRQVGTRGPMIKRQEALKVEIMNWMTAQRKDDWSFPNDKLVLAAPGGGEMLINYSNSGFRAKKA